MNLTLLENRNGVDQWGNEGMVVQDLGKDRRLAGERGPILGNYKTIGSKPAAQAPATCYTDDSLDDVPF